MREYTSTGFPRLAVAMITLVALVAGEGSAQGVRLSAHAAAPALYVGQPLVLVVTVTASQPVRSLNLDLTDAGSTAPLRVMVQRGASYAPYRELSLGSGWREEERTLPKRGERTLEYVLSYDASLADWPFPAPGDYRLAAEYTDGATSVRSNEVVVSVSAPTGSEATVLAALRQLGPQILAHHVPARLSGPVRDLVEQYPTSAYLQEVRLLDLDARIAEIGQGYDPDDARPSTDLSRRPELADHIVASRLGALLPMALALAEVPGQFQPNALVSLAGIYQGIGDDAAAHRVYERVAREFPDRIAAAIAREQVSQARVGRRDRERR